MAERQLLLELMRQVRRSEESRPRRLGLTSAPLSFAQQRLWILDQMNPGDPSYNIAAAVKIEGPLQVALLEQALKEIVRRHEILRTTFQTIDSEPVQVISNDVSSTSIVNVKDETEARRFVRESAQRSFDFGEWAAASRHVIETQRRDSLARTRGPSHRLRRRFCARSSSVS